MFIEVSFRHFVFPNIRKTNRLQGLEEALLYFESISFDSENTPFDWIIS
jgi:hypothetical protein